MRPGGSAGRRGRREAVRIGNVLERSFSALGLGSLIKEFRLRHDWESIVGKAIARNTRPGRLLKKTLYVGVTSSAWMNELVYHKEDMLSRLNDALGKGSVKDIAFRQARSGVGDEAPNGKDTGKTVTTPRRLGRGEKEFIDAATRTVKNPELKKLIKRAMEKGKAIDAGGGAGGRGKE